MFVCQPVALFVPYYVDVGRVDDAVAPGLVHHRAHGPRNIGILLAADEQIFSAFVPLASVLRRGRRGPDGVHDGLQARRGKALGSGAPVQPGGPGGG